MEQALKHHHMLLYCKSEVFNRELFLPLRATGQVTPTGIPSSERSRGTRVTWRFPPRSQRLCLRRMETAPHGCPSSSCSSGTRGRRHAGSTHPTATQRSAWRAERSATTAGRPWWAEFALVKNMKDLIVTCNNQKKLILDRRLVVEERSTVDIYFWDK